MPYSAWSGQTCVPQAECGCFYRGRYYNKHQMFYAHEQCLERCVCGRNGTVSCQKSSCAPGEACRVVDGVLGCHPVSYGRCVATGDPHYFSFDGRFFDFQGTWVYTLAKVCDRAEGQLVNFSVDTQNEQIGNRRVSGIKNLTVTVYNLTISIRRGEHWRVIVNNEFVTLPSSFGHQVTINRVGQSVRVQTDFGLRVLYDASYHAEVHVPSNYQGHMCGLCGNYNGNPADDFLLPNGTQSTSVNAFGQAWALPATGVQSGGASSPQQCDQTKAESYRRGDACGLMAAVTGPFSACHDRVNPEQHVINCVFDMCVMDGDGAMLCENLQAYAIICQQAGIQIMPWRNSSFCLVDCPANSHYAQCSNNCANTCASLSGSVNNCPDICMEGCQCDEGWLSDGDACVPVGDCGCVHNGKYLKVGEVLVTDTCNMKCVCRATGLLECVSQTCARGEICEVRDGQRDCYTDQGHCVFDDEECQMKGPYPTCVKKPNGICWAMGDPHYCTFDQRYFDFMGTCTYVVTRNWQENDSLPAFEVLAKNENRGDPRVSYVAHVIVNFGGIIISIESCQPGKVKSVWSLPVVLDDVGVSMFQSGSFITILFSFGLSVQYDWDHYLMVSLPTVFMDKVSGLCGNFNGDPKDDFTMPSNTQADSATEFGQSWKVHNLTLDEGCRDDGWNLGCDAEALKQWQGENYCGLLMMAPFSQCHSVIEPSIYIQNCMYDVCMTEGQRNYLCKVFEVYASACQHVGIQLTNWREAANCCECPENSHYEFCGSACPLTCMGLGSPVNCTLPCVETCACDPGFVLSGSECIPSAQCGCSYNGHYIPAGETFWADDACQRLCRCSMEGGHLECQDGGCGTRRHCQVENGIRDCYPVSQSTCMALGDPHYYTFDGNHLNFQGNCVYQLVGLNVSDPGLVPFDVLVQNDFRGSKVVSFTKLLEIRVHFINQNDFLFQVNGELLNLPLHLIEGQVSVFRSGWSAVVQTSFGLKVTFDWNSFATVTVPSTYMGAICGLCGNYNGNPEDDLTVRGMALPASGPMEIGASWSVAEIPDCVHGCTESCQDCDPTRRSVYETSDFCGLLRDPQGPFKDCQTVLNPAQVFEDCVYDVCLYNGRRDLLCQAITAYVYVCQAMGRTISPWRTAEFCGVQCTVHSHYEPCGSGCEVTCHSLTPPAGCRSPCMEGCVCDEGYIRTGDRCVPFSQCGCLYGNRYYLLYQQFYPGSNCEQVCTCLPDGQGSYDAFSCFSFTLVCFVAVCACGDLQSYKAQIQSVLFITCIFFVVFFFLYDPNTTPFPQINGVLTNLPYSSNSLNGSLVQAYKDGGNYVIKTGFGLKVTYDLSYYVTVTIPGNYRCKTCGLCGNFDGDPSNDFRLPDGNVTQDVNIFRRAWKVHVPGVVCEDGCEGDACLDCNPRLKAVFEKPPYCRVLVDPNGPFAACHTVVNSSAYLNDCVFDACASDGNSKVVCDSVARYAFSCHTAGVGIQNWRTDSFCPMSCPTHSHYELCSDVCSAACPGLTAIVQCSKTCAEGCTCDNGYLFDGQQCVEHQQCGCYDQGHTYKVE
uniref:VWFD domain-containing protein n=1 Tax=Sinocyclocheilus rhinocerous TaxID=307959 RepID=A0A673JYW8_9TELE